MNGTEKPNNEGVYVYHKVKVNKMELLLFELVLYWRSVEPPLVADHKQQSKLNACINACHGSKRVDEPLAVAVDFNVLIDIVVELIKDPEHEGEVEMSEGKCN